MALTPAELTALQEKLSSFGFGMSPSTGQFTGGTGGALSGFEGLGSIPGLDDTDVMGGGLPPGMTWEQYQNSPQSVQVSNAARYRTIEGKTLSEFGSMKEYENALEVFMAKPAVQPDSALQQSNPTLFKTLTDEYNDKTNPLIGSGTAFADPDAVSGLRYSQYGSPEEYQAALTDFNTRRQAAKAETKDDSLWDRLRYPVIAGGALFGGAVLGAGAGAGGGGAAAGGTATGGTVAGTAAGGTVAGGSATGIGSGLSVGLGTSATPAIGSGLSLGGLSTAGGTQLAGGTALGGAAAGGGSAAGGGLSSIFSNPNTQNLLGTAIGIGGSIYSSEQASDAAKDAAAISAESQREQLEYLKQINELPQQYKEAALRQLGGGYGLDPEFSQEQFMQGAQASPLYQAILSGRGAGEESILRQASATGGLRSGNVQENLYDYNVQLENKALQNYMSGLQGMAGLPTSEAQIGNVMSNIGQTQAGGITSSSQAEQQGLQGIYDALGTGLGTYFEQQGRSTI